MLFGGLNIPVENFGLSQFNGEVDQSFKSVGAGKNLTIAIEENDAILELFKQWRYRKYVNHVTFFKSYVTFSKIHRLTFI